MTDYCDNPEEHGCGRRSADHMLDDRLRTAYATGMRSSHDGARVEVHMGIDVLQYLRDHMPRNAPLGGAPTVWGLPLKVRDSFPPSAIEVHTVQVIA